MTIVSANRSIAHKRGDGILPVTLLCLLGVAAAAASFVLTETFLSSRDSLARFVPADAAYYYHAERGGAGQPAVTPAVLPQNFDADEVGRFAVATADGQSLDQGTLLAWRWPRRPNADEAGLLTGLAAIRFDDRTYLIAGDAVVRGCSKAFASGDGLISDPRTAAMLSAVRELSRTQLYFNPVSLPAAALPKAARWLKSAEPFAASIGLEDGRLLSTAIPRSQADRLIPFLGIAPAGIGRTAVRRPDGAAAFFSGEPAFNARAVLLGRVQQAAVRLGLKPDSRLASAEQALAPLLDTPVTLAVWIGQGNDIEFLAELPRTSPRIVQLAIASYFSASLPDRQPVQMPDGDTYDEFRFNPDKYSFVAATDVPGLATISDRETGVGLSVRDDGRGGTLVASSSAAMARSLGTGSNKAGVCDRPGGQKLIIDKELLARWLDLLPELRHIGLDKLDLLYFSQNPDGILITCG